MALRIISNSFIFLWALWVAAYDLKFHMIRNRLLVVSIPILWPILWISGRRIDLNSSTLIFIAILVIAGTIYLIGMGDVKLVLILAPWLRCENWQISLVALLGVVWLQSFLLTVKNRIFPKQIALAPAILIACAVNLAT